MSLDKQSLRDQHTQRRNALSPQHIKRAAHDADTHLKQHPKLSSAQHIGLYYPIKTEISLLEFTHTCWAQDKAVYLPICTAQTLMFGPYTPGASLTPGPYGTPEPIGTTPICAAALDVLILPCLACDDVHHRLGYGKGFYDKTLAHLKQRPYLIGIIYDIQHVKTLPNDPWDIPMDDLCIIPTTEHPSTT